MSVPHASSFCYPRRPRAAGEPRARPDGVFFEEQFYLLSHGNSSGCFFGFKPQRRNKAVGCARMSMWPKTADLDLCSLSDRIVPWVQSQLCKHSTWNMGLCIYVCSTHGCKHTSRAECLRRDALAARRPRPTRLTALPHVAIATKPPPASSPRHYTLAMARSCPSSFGENNVPKIIVDRLGESWPPDKCWPTGAGSATKVASKVFTKVAP